MRKIVILSILILFLGGCSEDMTANNHNVFSWRQTNTTLALLKDDTLVWQLNFNPEEGKPYFHPICLTDGTELTWLRPPDHTWHRALWFSWKFIDKLNYWEEDEQGKSEGQTELTDVDIKTSPDGSATIEMSLNYQPWGQPTVLKENRIIKVNPTDKNGNYCIDWKSDFTACKENVKLARTPLRGEPGGRSWGGYAGLSVRPEKTISDIRVINSQGNKDMKCHGKKAKWLEYDFIAKNNNAAGFAIFDHPDNFRYPSPWYVAIKRPMRYFGPAVLFDKPHTLSKNETITLRYRVFIHQDRLDTSTLEKQWKAFSRSKF